jgi:hypothetical protein
VNSTRHHAAIVFSITIYRNAAANATMIKSFPGLRNTRILILSILATLFVLPVWSASTGFSRVVDSSSQPSLGNNSSNTNSSAENNKICGINF